MMQALLDSINYLSITICMAIESSFIPFPSEVVMIPAAYIAAETSQMSYPLIILFGTIGALIGAAVNYILARTLGRTIVYAFANSRIGHFCLLDSSKIEKAEQYFNQHGSISTLIGRMIPAIRQLISIPAGLAKMKLFPFFLFTAIGAALWNSILVALGIAFHSLIDQDTLVHLVSHYSHIIGYSAIALVCLFFLFLIYKAVKKK